MEQQSEVETLDSSSNDQSQSSSSDPSLSRNSSFSRLNAQAPEFVPTRNSSTQSKQQVQQPPRVVMPPPPPPSAMIHSPHHPPLYSPHGTGAFHVAVQNHVIPVHHQIHHPQHHVPVQNYHHHHRNHNQNQNHHRQQSHHNHNNHNSSSNHHQYEDQQEVEFPVKDQKEKKSDESVQKILNQVSFFSVKLSLFYCLELFWCNL
ncbi:la-related protein 6B [Melia azedarach]|uniref:La-related protein 6B n=1 Tax=Melia azedarach TaxID=155640 RepID=A0ACC1YJC7_MELAZ|nr:la-related protein 6B [Melia azedarach]